MSPETPFVEQSHCVITTFVAYCRLALFEEQLQKGKVLSASEAAHLVESWEEIYRHPNRYISQTDVQHRYCMASL